MRKLIIAAALLFSTAAQANDTTGNTLLADLHSRNGYRMASAIGYIQGVADSAHGSRSICMPGSATAAIKTELVRNWLIANPSDRYRYGENVVAMALHEVWPPCAQR